MYDKNKLDISIKLKNINSKNEDSINFLLILTNEIFYINYILKNLF